MASSPPKRLRRSLTDLQKDYDSGKKKALETVMRAWKGLKELPHDDPRSFFMLGGFHGEPFRGKGKTSGAWWGGYCQHGTVLFPTWHRAYLYALENALRSIPGCADMTLPFWDECSAESLAGGIPRALTDKTFELDGKTIPNPLRSFTFPVEVRDMIPADNNIYLKPKGYETVRYPLSGLVGTEGDRAATAAHNAKYPSYAKNVGILNRNIKDWLTLPLVFPQTWPGTKPGKPQTRGLVHQKFIDCLSAPNYTLFSNTTSAKNWNDANKDAIVTPLESPHNFVHLAVGGFDVPGVMNADVIRGANGDMGENNTAALDPIFFFHHCFIDYTFWCWQKKHKAKNWLTIDSSDPGANYVVQVNANNQPPASADVTAPISMSSPLLPFMVDEDTPYTSNLVVNIETQLDYTYGPGSLDEAADPTPDKALVAAAAPAPARVVHVSGLNRGKIPGSFLIAAYADVKGKRTLIDVEPVLSRWNTEGCANCQNHLETTADFRVPEALAEGVEVLVHTRGGVIGGDVPPEQSVGFVESVASVPEQNFRVEIR